MIFIVVPEASKTDMDKFVLENVAPSLLNIVRILTDVSASRYTTDQLKQVASDLAADISAFGPNPDHYLFIHRDAKCDDRQLKREWRDIGNNVSKVQKAVPLNIRRDVTLILQAKGAFWREYANAQIANFDGKKASLDAWLQQFGELGCTMVGRRLVAQLRVIRPGQMKPDPFAPRTEDRLGQRQLHCYVRDEDRGGSWVSIQDALTHSHSPSAVGEIFWDKTTNKLLLPQADLDEVVVYEDGLWSGSETVRRLRALKDSPVAYTLRLKFAVVSDFGILVVRHAIRSLGLSGRVILDCSGAELMTFLRDDLSTEMQFGDGMATDVYYDRLHDFTFPHAFRNPNSSTAGDLDICAIIGGQLVIEWQTHTKKRVPTPKTVKLFELGGGRFASTTLFSRSIPKVTLPLFWLDGPVEFAGRKIGWKPLFVDPRRISDETLLTD